MERKKSTQKRGTVVSAKMDKTVVVNVRRTIRHPRFDKIVFRKKKYYAHVSDENLNLKEGDEVVIAQTRPISKLKSWRVVEKVSEAK